MSNPSSHQTATTNAAPVQRAQPIASAADGARLIGQLNGAMDALLGLVEEETALVRKGSLRAAMAIGARKTELAHSYFADTERLKANAAFLAAHARQPLNRLRARHETFRARLQLNLTVLATAHAVSEGLIRGVAGEVARRSAPQTYGQSGRANPPARSAAQPIAISRTS